VAEVNSHACYDLGSLFSLMYVMYAFAMITQILDEFMYDFKIGCMGRAEIDSGRV